MGEKRLIDANALLTQLAIDETGIRRYLSTLDPNDCNNGYDIFVSTIQIGEIERFRWVIEEAPTVEVLGEQKALKPLNIEDHYLAETYDYDYSNAECSCCKAGFSFDEYHRPSYCSECGAKFDWSEE